MSHPKNAEAEPLCCPWCASGSGALLRGGRPIAGEESYTVSLHNAGRDLYALLEEYQCRNEDCGRSFWV